MKSRWGTRLIRQFYRLRLLTSGRLRRKKPLIIQLFIGFGLMVPFSHFILSDDKPIKRTSVGLTISNHCKNTVSATVIVRPGQQSNIRFDFACEMGTHVDLTIDRTSARVTYFDAVERKPMSGNGWCDEGGRGPSCHLGREYSGMHVGRSGLHIQLADLLLETTAGYSSILDLGIKRRSSYFGETEEVFVLRLVAPETLSLSGSLPRPLKVELPGPSIEKEFQHFDQVALVYQLGNIRGRGVAKWEFNDRRIVDDREKFLILVSTILALGATLVIEASLRIFGFVRRS